MSSSALEDPSEETRTTIRKYAEGDGDILDLAMGLAQLLVPAWRDARAWVGRYDADATRENLVRDIERGMPRVTDAVRGFLLADIAFEDLCRRAYSIVDIVDQLVGTRANPQRPPFEEPWASLYRRLLIWGRFNPDALRGAVIPARGIGSPLLDSARIGTRLCFVTPLRPFRLWYQFIGARLPVKGGEWRIATVPVPHTPRVARHERSLGFELPHYQMTHGYSEEDRSRFCTTLREIEEDGGVPFVVFPEAALDTASVDRLRDEYTRIGADRDTASGIQMLALGHCGYPGSPGYNCVTVLRRDGDVAWQQAKLNGYNLQRDIIERQELPLPILPDDDYYRERLDLAPGPTVTVADTPFGRLMIAICEDAAHLSPSVRVAVEAGVTHLLLPLLDSELDSSRWFAQRFRGITLEKACVGVACTSAFLEMHLRTKGRSAKALDSPVTVLLIHRPPWRTPQTTTWDPTGPRLWVDGPAPMA